MYRVMIVRAKVEGGNHIRQWYQCDMFNSHGTAIEMWDAIAMTEWWTHNHMGSGQMHDKFMLIVLAPGDSVYINEVKDDSKEENPSGEKGINVKQG